jgi:hypothetical protein
VESTPSPKSCNDVVTAVIAVGFAVTIPRNNRMRSLSVAAILVVGYVLSAVAQNSTPELKLDNPGRPVLVVPNLKPPVPDNPFKVTPNLESLSPVPDNPAAQVAPNLESLSPVPDNPAMQTLKSLAPELESPTTQAIPDASASKPR